MVYQTTVDEAGTRTRALQDICLVFDAQMKRILDTLKIQGISAEVDLLAPNIPIILPQKPGRPGSKYDCFPNNMWRKCCSFVKTF